MTRVKTLQDLFKRYRRPGDFALAFASFAFAVTLLFCLPYQTTWVERATLYAQPAFWPALSLAVMALFSGLHLVGALVSERISGRWQEMLYWLRSAEYALWLMAYVAVVPRIGYLLGTVAFTNALAFRLGYRGARWAGLATLFAVTVVVIFKGFLQVRIPAGDIYGLFPAGAFRSFLMTYL